MKVSHHICIYAISPLLCRRRRVVAYGMPMGCDEVTLALYESKSLFMDACVASWHRGLR